MAVRSSMVWNNALCPQVAWSHPWRMQRHSGHRAGLVVSYDQSLEWNLMYEQINANHGKSIAMKVMYVIVISTKMVVVQPSSVGVVSFSVHCPVWAWHEAWSTWGLPCFDSGKSGKSGTRRCSEREIINLYQFITREGCCGFLGPYMFP